MAAPPAIPADMAGNHAYMDDPEGSGVSTSVTDLSALVLNMMFRLREVVPQAERDAFYAF